jgi:hypothetical protein
MPLPSASSALLIPFCSVILLSNNSLAASVPGRNTSVNAESSEIGYFDVFLREWKLPSIDRCLTAESSIKAF